MFVTPRGITSASCRATPTRTRCGSSAPVSSERASGMRLRRADRVAHTEHASCVFRAAAAPRVRSPRQAPSARSPGALAAAHPRLHPPPQRALRHSRIRVRWRGCPVPVALIPPPRRVQELCERLQDVVPLVYRHHEHHGQLLTRRRPQRLHCVVERAVTDHGDDGAPTSSVPFAQGDADCRLPAPLRSMPAPSTNTGFRLQASASANDWSRSGSGATRVLTCRTSGLLKAGSSQSSIGRAR